MTRWIAGVDGCPGGWIAVLVDAEGGAPPRAVAMARFAEILDRPEAPAVVAVDMPIGLPERLDGHGRACEVAVRKLLGERQSSVFAIPARAAVMEAAVYRLACAIAAAHSTPPRKIAKQAFNLFPRIAEIDALLRARPELRGRVFETHPEVCFMHMNGGRPAALPKKVKSRPNPPGLAERQQLLLAQGFPEGFLEIARKPPGKAGTDDVLDACACAWTARRILKGEATCYPDRPARDAFGLEMAIRA